jgi:hypothetical protein
MQALAQPDPDVATAAMPDGDMVLVHHGTGLYFCLNETGTFLWNLLAESVSPDGMSQALFDAFDITRETAGDTVRALIDDLKSHHLITIRQPGPPLS